MSHTGELPPGGFDSVRGSPAQHFQGIVTKMQDALMRGDLDTYCSYLAEDFEFADSGAPRVLPGFWPGAFVSRTPGCSLKLCHDSAGRGHPAKLG